MSILDSLIACAGSWRGTSTLQDPGNLEPQASSSDLTVTPVLGGRFVRLDYTWSYNEAPQEGSLLIGFNKKAETVTAHWIDSFHNGNNVMACTGPKPDGPTLSVRGSYAAPPGPDWGWRIAIIPPNDGPDAGGALRIVMHNLWPEGEREDLAVEATYTRV